MATPQPHETKESKEQNDFQNSIVRIPTKADEPGNFLFFSSLKFARLIKKETTTVKEITVQETIVTDESDKKARVESKKSKERTQQDLFLNVFMKIEEYLGFDIYRMVRSSRELHDYIWYSVLRGKLENIHVDIGKQISSWEQEIVSIEESNSETNPAVQDIEARIEKANKRLKVVTFEYGISLFKLKKLWLDFIIQLTRNPKIKSITEGQTSDKDKVQPQIQPHWSDDVGRTIIAYLVSFRVGIGSVDEKTVRQLLIDATCSYRRGEKITHNESTRFSRMGLTEAEIYHPMYQHNPIAGAKLISLSPLEIRAVQERWSLDSIRSMSNNQLKLFFSNLVDYQNFPNSDTFEERLHIISLFDDMRVNAVFKLKLKPSQILKLNSNKIEALLEGRTLEELQDLSDYQVFALTKNKHLQKSDVIGKSLHQIQALLQGRDPNEIVDLKEYQITALLQNKHLTRSNVEHLEENQILALVNGLDPANVKGLSELQVRALINHKELQREDVEGLEYPYQIDAVLNGRKAWEVKGFKEIQVKTLVIRKDLTREDIELFTSASSNLLVLIDYTHLKIKDIIDLKSHQEVVAVAHGRKPEEVQGLTEIQTIALRKNGDLTRSDVVGLEDYQVRALTTRHREDVEGLSREQVNTLIRYPKLHRMYVEKLDLKGLRDFQIDAIIGLDKEHCMEPCPSLRRNREEIEKLNDHYIQVKALMKYPQLKSEDIKGLSEENQIQAVLAGRKAEEVVNFWEDWKTDALIHYRNLQRVDVIYRERFDLEKLIQAVGEGRNPETLRDLNGHQIQAIMTHNIFSEEDLKKFRDQIYGLTADYQIEAVISGKRRREEVAGLWCEAQVTALIQYKQLFPIDVEGITENYQVEAMVHCHLTREQVLDPRFSQAHFMAIQEGFAYDDIIGCPNCEVNKSWAERLTFLSQFTRFWKDNLKILKGPVGTSDCKAETCEAEIRRLKNEVKQAEKDLELLNQYKLDQQKSEEEREMGRSRAIDPETLAQLFPGIFQ